MLGAIIKTKLILITQNFNDLHAIQSINFEILLE